MKSPITTHISETYIKPKFTINDSETPYYLAPWDLLFLSVHYNQKGLLFAKPKNELFSIETLLEGLKNSLELTLVHFYPLAGQFTTKVDQEQHQCLIYVDCNKGPGARFTHVSLDMSISDILSPTHVPAVVKSFFDLSNGEVNHDGHEQPLLSIRVTELVDGIFIGCSMSHVLVDGMSFWHFWKVWSELHRADGKQVSISSLPVHKRWVPDGFSVADLSLPFTSPREFIFRYDAPELKERFFHFSAETVAKLKAKANEEDIKRNISSFQALAALVWKSIIRAKKLPDNQVTHCKLAANNRSRIKPPLPDQYLGNSISILTSTTTVGELLQSSLGFAAGLLHQSVMNHTDTVVRDLVEKWVESPFVYRLDKVFDTDANGTVQVGSSPRFHVYGNEFLGLGKPIAVRCGYANKFGGKVIAFPGYEGGGSVELEISLAPHEMNALEADEVFMSFVSSPH